MRLINLKRFLLVSSILMLLIISLSLVSASDFTNDTIISSNTPSIDSDMDAICINETNSLNDIGDTKIDTSNEKELNGIELRDSIINESDNSFTDIQNSINDAEDNGTITLKHNHYYGNGTQIIINKSITIDGNGSTLDANFLSRIFYIVSDNVVLKNMTFINANSTDKTMDGFIEVVNSTDNIDYYKGAVIRWLGDNGHLLDCNFTHNYFYPLYLCDGKVISWQGKNGIIENSNFECNYVKPYNIPVGGPILSKLFDVEIHGNYLGDLYDNLHVYNATLNACPQLILNNFSLYYGEDNPIAFGLKSNNISLANESIDILIYNIHFNQTYNLFTNENGFAYLDVSDFDVGKYFMLIKYGDGMKNISENRTLEIKKIESSIITNKFTTNYSSNKLFNVKIKDNKGKLLSGAKITLKIYSGKKFKTYTKTSNSKGMASFNISRLSAGTHKTVITASGNVIKTQKTETIKINKAYVIGKINKNVFKYKKSSKAVIKILNKALNKPIIGLSVKLKVCTGKKYKSYTLKTNKKGQIYFSTKNLKKGKHKLTLSSNNKNYNLNKNFLVRIS